MTPHVDPIAAAGVVYMVATTGFGFWQWRRNKRQDREQKGRQSRDDLVTLLQTKLGFAEQEIELLKVKVTAQGSQIDVLSRLPFDRLHADHERILEKLAGSAG